MILGSASFRCSASKQNLVSQQYLSHLVSLAFFSLPLSLHSPDTSDLSCTQLFELLNHLVIWLPRGGLFVEARCKIGRC